MRNFLNFLMLFVVVLAVLCACVAGNYGEVVFENKSAYRIRVTLDKPYKTDIFNKEISTDFFVVGIFNTQSESKSVSVYVEEGSCGFSWIPLDDYRLPDPKKSESVDVSIDGSKVYFENK